ncbi:MAG: CPBP family intramembrane metalloprotease [Nitrososphaerota archaeon]|nr:CPBP family intramembrane metalloprotease [Nitrososphaerota archaeon]
MGAEAGEGRVTARVLPLGVFLALLAFTVVLVAASVPAGIYAMFSGKLSATASAATLVRPYLWLGPVPIVFGYYVPAGVLFGAVMAVYVAMLVYGVLQQARPWRAVAASVREGFGALGSSPFVVMMVSIGFLTFTASMIDNVTSAAGVPIGAPAGDPLELFLGFTVAPVVEELGFRVVLIGLVALVLSLGKSWKEALGALWRPSMAMDGLAVGGGTAIIIWAATGLSSVAFGACHVACGGSGWQIGKFPEAAFGGLVLGYVYVKYGFHVAVITHWGIDYFGSAFSFYGQAAYGIPWNSGTTEYVGQYLVDYDLLLLFGLASFLLVAYLGLSRIARRRRPAEAEPFIPPPPGGGPGP